MFVMEGGNGFNKPNSNIKIPNMKKISSLIAILVLCAVSLFAQAPEKFTYQAVVRNASNALISNAQVGVRVNILQGSATGNAVYSESHVTSTNANGLITVNIGGGSVLHGGFASIDWSDGPYFLKTDIDPNGGNDYSITSTQQLLSVPYALYAKDAGNGFSGDYNDLTNTPTIPIVPTNVSAFTNDAGYITASQVPAQVNADWNATSGAAEILNKPTIPSVPTNVSAFTNDAGYITGYTETDPQFNAWDKDYNDLINKPTIPTVPTSVSAFTNDVGYITVAQIPAQVNADWNATTGAALILNKPTLFSGNYNDLTNKPTLFDGNYNSLSNKPNLAAVALSGSYNDLINKPSIPTAVGELTNNVGYITLSQVPAQVNADWNATNGAALILNKPTIPTVPTNVSAFTNDAGYITSAAIPTVPTNVSAFTNDAGYVTVADVQQAAGVPTNVSAFNNDMGYLTSYTETDPLFTAWGKNYNTLNNKPNLATVATSGNYNDLSNRPTIPTNVSAFTNDAGYITASQVPEQVNADWNATSGKAKILNKPSNVSAFDNDAHYITEAELNALLAAMNNTIDSLRDRIEELENGGTPVPPDPVTPDTTITPGTSVNIDGLACPGTATVTDWDGNVYNTVAIGQQCWLKENLRSTHYADGQPITLETSTTSTTTRYRYNPGGNASNLYTYGFVYNWPAVMYGSQSSNANPSNVRGICPMGWHVPSNQEWSQLTNYVSGRTENRCDGSAQNIAKALASNEINYWTSNSISCTVGDYAPNNNTTGFSALPAGHNSGGVGTYANFWSCTQSDNSIAYAVQLGSSSTVVTVNADASKEKGYSVRCIRDSAITLGVAQMVVTGNVSGITTNSVICGGTVNPNNGLQVNERGLCWGQMPNPNVSGNHTTNGSGIGSFTASISGLQSGTTYYVRAYTSTAAGIAYGDCETFTTQPDASDCGTSTITDYDGNSYNTVKIGSQCWLKENLRTVHYADGTVILAANGSDNEPFYVPSGSMERGHFYNWYAVMHGAASSASIPSGVRGVCPIGWHVPSDAEWSQLTQFVSSQDQYLCANEVSNIAKSLASHTGWSVSTSSCAIGNEPSGNNATGFSALPAPVAYSSGVTQFRRYYGGMTPVCASDATAFYTSTTELSDNAIWLRYFNTDNADVWRICYSNLGKDKGFPVRCLRD